MQTRTNTGSRWVSCGIPDDSVSDLEMPEPYQRPIPCPLGSSGTQLLNDIMTYDVKPLWFSHEVNMAYPIKGFAEINNIYLILSGECIQDIPGVESH